MENQVAQIAERIKGMRLIMELTIEEMARITDTTVEEYTAAENGQSDFSFTFLYKCAKTFGIDLAELLTGEAPHLSQYSIVRKGMDFPLNAVRASNTSIWRHFSRIRSQSRFLSLQSMTPRRTATALNCPPTRGRSLTTYLRGR